jgi:hypothetical protein
MSLNSKKYLQYRLIKLTTKSTHILSYSITIRQYTSIMYKTRTLITITMGLFRIKPLQKHKLQHSKLDYTHKFSCSAGNFPQNS